MATATVTSKGQITLPVAVMTALSLEAGSRVEFVELKNGQFAIIPVTSPVSAVKGMLRKPDAPVSIEAMNAAIVAKEAKNQ